MKTLIDQERNIYNEERERLEEDIQRAKMVAEAKLRLIKNRLLTLFEGEFSQETPIEELIERLVV
jgi:flagellar motor switch protein FliM